MRRTLNVVICPSLLRFSVVGVDSICDFHAQSCQKLFFTLHKSFLSLSIPRVPRCPADVHRVRVPPRADAFAPLLTGFRPSSTCHTCTFLNGPLRVPRQWGWAAASGAAPRLRRRRTFENRISTNELSQALLTLYCYLRRSCGGVERRRGGADGPAGLLSLQYKTQKSLGQSTNLPAPRLFLTKHDRQT